MNIIDDKYIIENFPFNKKNYWKCVSNEVKDYLMNRYDDSESIQESYYRVINHLEIRPVCKVCGNKLKFNIHLRLFPNHCSIRCSRKDSVCENQRKQTCLNKFGKLVNTEKFKQTCLEKYGVENVFQLPEIKNKISITHLINHGHIWWSNPEQSSQTLRNNYKHNKEKILSKTRKTCLEKYNVDNPAKSDIIKSKIISTNLSKYNKESFTQTEEYKIKSIKTNLEKYGYSHHNKSLERRQILKEQLHNENVQIKRLNSMKRNSSIKSSSQENKIFEILKTKFNNVIHTYRSEKYPFNCDFYIPELDLYIECQFSQYHHGRKYKGDDNDLEEVKILEQKSK